MISWSRSQVVADVLPVPGLPGVDPAERDQDDERAAAGAARQPAAFLPQRPRLRPRILRRRQQAAGGRVGAAATRGEGDMIRYGHSTGTWCETAHSTKNTQVPSAIFGEATCQAIGVLYVRIVLP